MTDEQTSPQSAVDDTTGAPPDATARAEQTLQLIENRAAHILMKQRQAAAILLDNHAPTATVADVDSAQPTLTDLESTAPHWEFLVPEQPAERAALVDILSARYRFTPPAAPTIARTLDMDPRAAAAAVGATDSRESPTTIEADVMQELEWCYVRRGETLFRQGDEADALYVVVDGLLRITKPGAGDQPPTVTEVGPGEILGSLALLAGKKQLVTVDAVRDSDICRLSRSAFEGLIERHPPFMMELATQLAQRIVSDGSVHWAATERAVVAVLVPACADGAAFASSLVAELEQYGATLHMTPQNMEGTIRQRFGVALEEYVDEYSFVDWLQEQSRQHKAVIYEAHPDYPNWTRRCIEQADRILIVGRAGEPPDLSTTESILHNMPHPDLLPPHELVLLHASRRDDPGDTRAWLAPRDVIRHHHVALDTGRGVDRVVRFLRGQAIGLVLGGGGMRVAACVGVIQALEEFGIRADVVGGTSAGSILAAEYAMGWDIDTIVQTTREKLMRKNVWMEPTLPLVSVTSARRLNAAYTEVFGDVYMEDLWITPFTISGNLTRAEMVVHQTGLLRHAVRSSTSLAGIHPPALTEDGELLIDGGIFNNTPADVARDMVDTGPVIAVDLGFTVRQRVDYDYGESLNGFRVLWSRINPFEKAIAAPSIVGIMMRANALASINASAEQVSHADLILRPPVTEYGLYDFDAYNTIADAGYRYGKEHIEKWLDTGGMEDV